MSLIPEWTKPKDPDDDMNSAQAVYAACGVTEGCPAEEKTCQEGVAVSPEDYEFSDGGVSLKADLDRIRAENEALKFYHKMMAGYKPKRSRATTRTVFSGGPPDDDFDGEYAIFYGGRVVGRGRRMRDLDF